MDIENIKYVLSVMEHLEAQGAMPVCIVSVDSDTRLGVALFPFVMSLTNDEKLGLIKMIAQTLIDPDIVSTQDVIKTTFFDPKAN